MSRKWAEGKMSILYYYYVYSNIENSRNIMNSCARVGLNMSVTHMLFFPYSHT